METGNLSSDSSSDTDVCVFVIDCLSLVFLDNTSEAWLLCHLWVPFVVFPYTPFFKKSFDTSWYVLLHVAYHLDPQMIKPVG